MGVCLVTFSWLPAGRGYLAAMPTYRGRANILKRPNRLRGLSNNGTASGDRGLKTAGYRHWPFGYCSSPQTCSKAKRAPTMASVSHHRDPIVILGA